MRGLGLGLALSFVVASGSAAAQVSAGPGDETHPAEPSARALEPPRASPVKAEAPAPYVPAATAPEPTGGFGANIGAGFSFVPTPPDMTLTTPDGGAMKQFSGDPLRRVGSMNMVALSISVLYRTASPLTFPLLGFEIGIPVSTGYPASIPLGAGAGALAWTRGGPTYYDGLDILGAGLTFPAGSARFAFDVLPGFRYITTTGTITQGELTIDAEARQYSFSLHADASACFGTKGAASICAFAAPHVFEFSRWMNGAVFGARLETN